MNEPRAESRRDFLKTTGIGLAAGLATTGVHAGVDETLEVGLIGCGGRGTGAATQAMNADKNVKLVALGDAFADRLQSSRAALAKQGGEKFAVDDDHCFVGLDAYQKVIDASDVVLLAAPPGFRPRHLAAAVKAGKHVFCEKPVATDGPGVRSVIESCKQAREKGLSVVSGLCWRYHLAMRETVQRVHDHQIGDVVSMQCNYNTRRPRVTLQRQPEWSDMEYQIRNWYFYTWLSGDHNVEQHIHSLDKTAWIMHDVYPERCMGMGGRAAVAPGETGNIYDHHAVAYEFPGGVRCYSFCRQQNGTAAETEDYILGTKGQAKLIRHELAGENAWKFRSRRGQSINMYQQEHDELFASIRKGEPIDNGDYMVKSTLMAIMGRMATYTGQIVTWEQALNSQESLAPSQYDWISLPEPDIAVPGQTKIA